MDMIGFKPRYPDQLDWQGRSTDWALLMSRVVGGAEGAFWEGVSAEPCVAGDCAEWGRGREGVRGLGGWMDRIDHIDLMDGMDWIDGRGLRVALGLAGLGCV